MIFFPSLLRESDQAIFTQRNTYKLFSSDTNNLSRIKIKLLLHWRQITMKQSLSRVTDEAISAINSYWWSHLCHQELLMKPSLPSRVTDEAISAIKSYWWSHLCHQQLLMKPSLPSRVTDGAISAIKSYWWSHLCHQQLLIKQSSPLRDIVMKLSRNCAASFSPIFSILTVTMVCSGEMSGNGNILPTTGNIRDSQVVKVTKIWIFYIFPNAKK